AHLAGQLGGERAGADPGGVGLGDTEHVVQVQGAEAAAGGGAAGGGVGGGDEGVGAVVDVQQGALGPLEEDVAAPLPLAVQQIDDVGDHGLQLLAPGQHLGEGGVVVQSLGLVVVHQGEVVVLHDFPELDGKALGVEQIPHPQAAAGDLVLVGGA